MADEPSNLSLFLDGILGAFGLEPSAFDAQGGTLLQPNTQTDPDLQTFSIFDRQAPSSTEVAPFMGQAAGQAISDFSQELDRLAGHRPDDTIGQAIMKDVLAPVTIPGTLLGEGIAEVQQFLAQPAHPAVSSPSAPSSPTIPQLQGSKSPVFSAGPDGQIRRDGQAVGEGFGSTFSKVKSAVSTDQLQQQVLQGAIAPLNQARNRVKEQAGRAQQLQQVLQQSFNPRNVAAKQAVVEQFGSQENLEKSIQIAKDLARNAARDVESREKQIFSQLQRLGLA